MKRFYNILTFSILTILSPHLAFSNNVIHPFSIKTPISSNTDLIPLKTLLSQLEKDYKVSFLYEANLIDDLYCDPPQNNYNDLELILKDILDQSKLTFIKISETSFVLVKKQINSFLYGVVKEKNITPLIGANINLLKQKKGAVSNLDGKYAIELKPGSYDVEVSYIGYKNMQKTIALQPGDSLELNFNFKEVTSLNQVVVVGSRFLFSPLYKKAEPADIITKEEIKSASFSQTGDLLQYSIPSFHSTYQTISDGTDHINPAMLRGLGPDQVLVLVNGKRRHHSALVNINGTIGKGTVSTDLNAIPSNAIERIEILRDGAAAQYGSDAIAGVINIILKENIQYAEMNLYAGINEQKDGHVLQVNGNYGFPLNNKGGFANLSLDFRNTGAINRSGDYTGPIFGDARDEHQDSVQLFFDQTGFNGRRVMSNGSAANTNASIMLNLNLPIGNKTELYAFGGFNYRMSQSGGFYRFPYQIARQSGLYPFGFSPELNANIFDKSFTVGFKNSLSPWKIDLSNTFGNNSLQYTITNSNNSSMGLSSPTSAKAGGFDYTQNVTNLDISRKLNAKIPIHIGVGSEFRVENYQQIAGEEASWKDCNIPSSEEKKEPGFQMFPGFQPENEVDEYRYNLGIYANIETELAKKFNVNLAGRYEYYSDFGSHLIWKISTRYNYKELITLRATYNTGFRAPSMPQIFFSNRGFQFVTIEDKQKGVQIAHFNNQNNITRAFGIQPLSAETSHNFNVGIIARVVKNLSLTLDAYRIDITNRIVISGRFTSSESDRFAQILRPTNVNHAQFFTNAIDTKTLGVDVGLNYHLSFPKSALRITMVGALSKTKLKKNNLGQTIIRTSDLLADFKTILFNREEISRIEVAQPSHKIIFRTNYKRNKWESTLSLTHFGSVQYIHPDDGNPQNWVLNENTGQIESRDQVFRPKWITDLSATYHFSNRVQLTIGGKNIFNVYPDQHTHSANISQGLFPYSRRVQQFGVGGAFLFGKVNFKFG